LAENESGPSEELEETEPKSNRGWIKWVLIVFLLYACLADDDDDERRFSMQDIEKGFHCLTGDGGSHRSFTEDVFRKLGQPAGFEHLETRVTSKDDQGDHRIEMQYRFGWGEVKNRTAEGVFRNSDCAYIVTTIE
jgi:hypothetical protein